MDSGSDAFAALGYCLRGHANDVKSGQTTASITFNGDKMTIKAQRDGRIDFNCAHAGETSVKGLVREA